MDRTRGLIPLLPLALLLAYALTGCSKPQSNASRSQATPTATTQSPPAQNLIQEPVPVQGFVAVPADEREQLFLYLRDPGAEVTQVTLLPEDNRFALESFQFVPTDSRHYVLQLDLIARRPAEVTFTGVRLRLGDGRTVEQQFGLLLLTTVPQTRGSAPPLLNSSQRPNRNDQELMGIVIENPSSPALPAKTVIIESVRFALPIAPEYAYVDTAQVTIGFMQKNPLGGYNLLEQSLLQRSPERIRMDIPPGEARYIAFHKSDLARTLQGQLDDPENPTGIILRPVFTVRYHGEDPLYFLSLSQLNAAL